MNIGEAVSAMELGYVVYRESEPSCEYRFRYKGDLEGRLSNSALSTDWKSTWFKRHELEATDWKVKDPDKVKD